MTVHDAARALYVAIYKHTHHGFDLTELDAHDNEGVHLIAAALQATRAEVWAVLDDIRDSVVHQRHQLEGYEIENDIINAVLGIIDDAQAKRSREGGE